MTTDAGRSLDDDFVAQLLRYAETGAGPPLPSDAEHIVDALLGALERGAVRAAERGADGAWRAVPWVKRGILLGFRVGRIVEMSIGGHHGEPRFAFFDKHTYPPQALGTASGVRIVPGGSAVRRGAYLAPGVVCMPPMYVNVGAWIGAGTMVDSHVLVGSCAQIGERVHLAAGVTIGGVLEPAGARPVIVEDDAFVGAGSRLLEGVLVAAGAVIGAGVVLTGTSRLYDVVEERELVGTAERPLVVPSGAVVVPGSRPAGGAWAEAR